jgi:hypothetical protein
MCEAPSVPPLTWINGSREEISPPVLSRHRSPKPLAAANTVVEPMPARLREVPIWILSS